MAKLKCQTKRVRQLLFYFTIHPPFKWGSEWKIGSPFNKIKKKKRQATSSFVILSFSWIHISTSTAPIGAPTRNTSSICCCMLINYFHTSEAIFFFRCVSITYTSPSMFFEMFWFHFRGFHHIASHIGPSSGEKKEENKTKEISQKRYMVLGSHNILFQWCQYYIWRCFFSRSVLFGSLFIDKSAAHLTTRTTKTTCQNRARREKPINFRWEQNMCSENGRNSPHVKYV